MVVKFDLSLKSSNVLFTFTSPGSEDLNIKLGAIFFNFLDGIFYPIVDPAVYFMSSLSKKFVFGLVPFSK